MSAVQTSKNLLRKEIKGKILQITKEEKRRQSDVVLKKLLDLPIFKISRRVSVYLSTENEVSTDQIVEQLFKLGKLCFVPRYNGDVMQMVKLTSMQDWSNLPLTKWNIKQPLLEEARDDAIETGGLDLIITPGVAFTKDGYRLGHGKGYYDSFLTKLFSHQTAPAKTVGLAFKEQIVNDLPIHEHDVKLDFVLCDT